MRSPSGETTKGGGQGGRNSQKVWGLERGGGELTGGNCLGKGGSLGPCYENYDSTRAFVYKAHVKQCYFFALALTAVMYRRD